MVVQMVIYLVLLRVVYLAQMKLDHYWGIRLVLRMVMMLLMMGPGMVR